MDFPHKENEELKVFISNRESVCGECGENLGSKAWITLAGDKGALCLECADLDHLEFLPTGDAALTRRARKYSTLSAVVLKWSRARKRYERQGSWSRCKDWKGPKKNVSPIMTSESVEGCVKLFVEMNRTVSMSTNLLRALGNSSPTVRPAESR